MDDELAVKLRARGEELLENHEKADIEATIEAVSESDKPHSASTAEILKTMVGQTAE